MEYSFSQTFGRETGHQRFINFEHDQDFFAEQNQINQEPLHQNINHQNIITRFRGILDEDENYESKKEQHQKQYNQKSNVKSLMKNKDQASRTPKFHEKNEIKERSIDELSSKVTKLLEELRKDNNQDLPSNHYRSRTTQNQSKSMMLNRGGYQATHTKKSAHRIMKTASHSQLPNRHLRQKTATSDNKHIPVQKSARYTPNKTADMYSRNIKYDSRSFLQSIKKNDHKYSLLSNIDTINSSINTTKGLIHCNVQPPKYFYDKQNERHQQNKKTHKKIKTIQSQFSSDEVSEVQSKYNEIVPSNGQNSRQNKVEKVVNKKYDQSFIEKIQNISRKIDAYQKNLSCNYQNNPIDNSKNYSQWGNLQSGNKVYEEHSKNNSSFKSEILAEISEKSGNKYEKGLNGYKIGIASDSIYSSNIMGLSGDSIQTQYPHKVHKDHIAHKDNISHKDTRDHTTHRDRKIHKKHKKTTETDPSNEKKNLQKSDKLKISQQIIKQLALDEQFRKCKKQFGKIPQGLNQLNKWQSLTFKLEKQIRKQNMKQLYVQLFGSHHEFSSCSSVVQGVLIEEIFQIKDEEADPFYSITLGDDQAEVEGIIDRLCQAYIKCQENYRLNIQRNYSPEQFSPLLCLMKNTTIALDQFIVGINELTRFNYKCRDGYLLYTRLKGKDSILSRVHLQGKMIKQSIY